MLDLFKVLAVQPYNLLQLQDCTESPRIQMLFSAFAQFSGVASQKSPALAVAAGGGGREST